MAQAPRVTARSLYCATCTQSPAALCLSLPSPAPYLLQMTQEGKDRRLGEAGKL